MKINLFIEYLSKEKRYASHTITAYQNDLNQFAGFLDEQYNINLPKVVKSEFIRSWIVELMEQKVSPRSANRKLSALKSYFKFLEKRNIIDKSPMTNIIAPKTGKRLPVVIKKDSLSRLFDDIEFTDDFDGVRAKMILELLYQTGIRKAELIKLKLSDVNFELEQLIVNGKGNKQRIVPFNHRLTSMLENYIQLRNSEFLPDVNGSLFVTNNGQPLYPKFVYNLVKKYLSLVTTEDQKGPHVLRHSFATHLSDNGADLNAIKELMGHSSLASTQVYMHNSIEQLKKIYHQAHPKSKTEN